MGTDLCSSAEDSQLGIGALERYWTGRRGKGNLQGRPSFKRWSLVFAEFQDAIGIALVEDLWSDSVEPHLIGESKSKIIARQVREYEDPRLGPMHIAVRAWRNGRGGRSAGAGDGNRRRRGHYHSARRWRRWRRRGRVGLRGSRARDQDCGGHTGQ